MLAVGVELDRSLVAVDNGVTETGPQSSPNPKVEGQPGHENAGMAGDVGGPVMRTVVHHKDVVPWAPALEVVENGGEALFLVVSGDDDERLTSATFLFDHASAP